MRTLLLDPNSLLEFLLNRSNFIGKVEYLSTIFRHNSGIQLYLSQPGLDKIVSLIKPLNGLKKTEQLVTKLKKRIKILRLTKAVAEKAKSSSINYDSAVEIHLAINKNINAIVTHQPDNFLLEELSIITLSDLQLNHLELSLSKNINDLPAILVTPLDKIFNLNRVFHLPSHIIVKPLKFKKYTRQLDPIYSSDKVSSLSGDNSSPRSTHTQSINRILIDAFLNPSSERLTCKSSLDASKASIERNQLSIKSSDRSTAQVDVLKSAGSVNAHLAYTSPIPSSLSESMLHAGKAYSSLVDGLSIKPLFARSIAQQVDILKSAGSVNAHLARTSPVTTSLSESIRHAGKAYFSLVDELSIKSSARSIAQQVDILKSAGSVNAHLARTSPVTTSLSESIRHAGKAYSSLVDELSIKSSARSIAQQVDILKSAGLVNAHLAHIRPVTNSLSESVRHIGKAYSSLVDGLSIKSSGRSTAQVDNAIVSTYPR